MRSTYPFTTREINYMNILGLDIGYSNLKLTYGKSGQVPSEVIVPSGAAPESCLPHGIRMTDEGMQVLIAGDPWRIGLPHGRFDEWSRALHQNYSAAPGYLALFYGALGLTGQTRFDKIVTGLPVAHWQDASLRQKLIHKLQGSHEIATGRLVDVVEVEVIPQPLGAYLERLWQSERDAIVLCEGRVLVVDPGFYSVDWIVIEGGALRKSGSGSSLDAMSVLIRKAVVLIEEQYQGQVSAEAIEDALRRGRSEIFLFGKPVPLESYLEEASEMVTHQVVEQLRESLRRETGSIDVVILAGGGAPYYRYAVMGAFGQSRVMMSKHPERANARGFFYFGEM